jgi:hypothetical protein
LVGEASVSQCAFFDALISDRLQAMQFMLKIKLPFNPENFSQGAAVIAQALIKMV